MPHTTIDTPVGELTLVKTDGGLSGVYLARQAHRPPRGAFGTADPGGFQVEGEQIAAYFAGERSGFSLELAPRGDAFHQAVWREIAAIPYGETRSYGQIAARLGNARLAREVGSAVGRNPLLIVVPCHRVIGANGDLTGYAGGLAPKRFLLAHENPARWGTLSGPTRLTLAGAGGGAG